LGSAGLLGGIYVWGASEVRTFERRAALDISAKLTGDTRQVSVRTDLGDPIRAATGSLRGVTIRASHFATEGLPLFTEPERSTRGKVKVLKLILDDFTLGGLRIERLEADIPNCRFDLPLAQRRKQVRLSRSGIGSGVVRIAAGDLGAYILRKFREIKRVSVEIQNGTVIVDGYGEFLIFNTNFRVVANLVPANDTQILLNDAVISFDGKVADPGSQKILLDTLNPVVDLRTDLKLLDAIQLEWVKMESGYLLAGGATKVPIRPVQRLEHLAGSKAAASRL
jgi:hypothetical protein